MNVFSKYFAQIAQGFYTAHAVAPALSDTRLVSAHFIPARMEHVC